ncbi:MAG: DUF721 domain-containing protein [Nitrospiraceae bacterium]
MRGPAFFDSVGSVLKSLVHRSGMESKLLEYQLRQRWPDIAGEQIAAHTCPDGIRFRKLYLIVENSVWLQQLMFLKPTLLESINAAAVGPGGSPAVTDIVLRVGDVAGGASEGTRQQEKGKREEVPEVGPAADSLEQASAHAGAVKDPGLRARLAEVMANALVARADSPEAPARPATQHHPRQR